MPTIVALTATPANMRRVASVPGVFALDRVNGGRFSATAGDYWSWRDDAPVMDADGRPLILCRERCEIVTVAP